MKAKKSPQADLENKKLIFRQIGAILALACVFLAFELKNDTIDSMSDVQRYIDATPAELIPITIQRPPITPAPPVAPAAITKVKDNSTEAEDITIEAAVSQSEAIAAYVPPQRPEERIEETEIVVNPEVMPEFPGGTAKLMAYLASHLKYPQLARQADIQGTVYLSFVVEKDGIVSTIELLRGIGGGCDEEAIRVVQTMPKWNPGRQNAKAVRVTFTLPIRFKLQ